MISSKTFTGAETLLPDVPYPILPQSFLPQAHRLPPPFKTCEYWLPARTSAMILLPLTPNEKLKAKFSSSEEDIMVCCGI